MKILRKSLTILFLLALGLVIVPDQTFAQSNTPIECGEIIQGELTAEEIDHHYELQVPAGTTIDIRVEPIGNSLNPRLILDDRAGNRIFLTNENQAGLTEETRNYVISTTNPVLQIAGVHSSSTSSGSRGDSLGAYILSLGCRLSDGTEIPYGGAASGTSDQDNPPSPPEVPSVDAAFVGFPGLQPVSFANAFSIPFTLNQANPASIPPGANAVISFPFDATENDVLSLDFSRVSGNLSLGLVVLSDTNEVVFQASLIRLNSLSAELTLPSTGSYRIGIFEIHLSPPTAPEQTAFEISAQLN